MEGTKPRMPCVHTGDVSCLFWWQQETGVTAGTLFTLNVCQAGDFPAGTTGPTPRWDHNRATGTVQFLRVPAWRCLKRRRSDSRLSLRTGVKVTCSEKQDDAVFVNRRHLSDGKRSDCTFHSLKTTILQDVLRVKMVFATTDVSTVLPWSGLLHGWLFKILSSKQGLHQTVVDSYFQKN